ncbi:protein FAR1-RELATED SEQUENCE 5-like isoform X2 [Oryza glaberrima]|nr:protein FAR1-RELATED SEQUENCE 5-like isoform X2 [Oryza glaberrima]
MAGNHISLEEITEYESVITKEFRSEDEGYKFYNDYAWSKGFSIRKDNVRYNGDGKVVWRRLCCSYEGYRLLKYFERTDQIREPRALTRCGCEAKLEMQLNEETGIWFVKDFNDGHAHPLAKHDQVAFLRSHRNLSDAQKAEVVELGVSGLRTCNIMDVMEKNHGGYDQVGFVSRDLYNFVARYKKERIEGMDAQFALSLLNEQKERDAEFFFEYNTDAGGHLKNMFWADAQSRIDYDAFGGVVVFDATYRVNRYNLPFVPFIGVNHHRSTVVFGCCLLLDETVSSYVWLLETFIKAMGGKRPRSFITDGDLSMANAIAKVCPDADHRLCTWHIEENAKRHLHGDALTEFRRLVYEVMKADEFERRWCAFKNRDNVPEKELWLAMMYALREKWATAYTDGRYFLGMRSNRRSEGLNSRIHSHLDRKMSLIDVIEHFMCCVSRMRRNEAEMDARASQSVPFTKISAEALEKSAARFFTHVIFREVRAEIRKICKWVILEVRQLDEARRYSIASKYDHKVHGEVSCSFDGALLMGVKCYCQMMDSKEIPCSHIFTVLKYLRIDIIPQCCVVVRWTLQVKAAFPSVRTANVHEWSE